MRNLKIFGGLIVSSVFISKLKQKSININFAECTENYERAAVCILNPHNSNTKGLVLLKQQNLESPTIIKGKFSGLKSNAKHGFHIHEFGDLTDGCNTAGPHFNPTGQYHGGPDDSIRHIGDLGNILSDSDGNAVYEREDRSIGLIGKYSVIGRSMVVHQDEDDLGRGNFPDSKITGHSGNRVACGIIALCSNDKLI